MAADPITALQRAREIFAQPVLASFVAGGVAGAVSRTVVSPLERLKILFQVQSVGRNEYKMSVPKALAKMWREEGWRGFMAGNGTNCIRIVPYSAVQFSAYNVYKRVSSPSPCCRHMCLPLPFVRRLIQAATWIHIYVLVPVCNLLLPVA
jgi:solute carrier family 25 phosphate transporter 23/24/25/41